MTLYSITYLPANTSVLAATVDPCCNTFLTLLLRKKGGHQKYELINKKHYIFT